MQEQARTLCTGASDNAISRKYVQNVSRHIFLRDLWQILLLPLSSHGFNLHSAFLSVIPLDLKAAADAAIAGARDPRGRLPERVPRDLRGGGRFDGSVEAKG